MTDPTPPTTPQTPDFNPNAYTLPVLQAAKTLESEATKQGLTRSVAQLADDLDYSLAYSGETDMADLLLLQARVLDSAFNALLPKYDPKYPNHVGLSSYSTALKAQQQCCRTIRVLSDLKNRKPKKT